MEKSSEAFLRSSLFFTLIALCKKRITWIAESFWILAILSLFLPTSPARAQTSPLKLTEIASGLKEPYLLVEPPDDSKRLLVAERGNRIRTIREGSLERRAFLDLEEYVDEGNEFAIKGLAFPQNYKTSNAFYIAYDDPNKDSLVARIQASEDDRADGDSLKAILKIIHSGSCDGIHALSFGPQDLLLVGIPAAQDSQSTNPLCGKILRLDVLNSENYAIPANNPFPRGRKEPPEVWIRGLHDVFSLHYSPEKIQVIGLEKRKDGKQEIFSLTADSNRKAQLTEIGNDIRNRLIGGYSYSGSSVPALKGQILFAETNGTGIYGLQEDPVTRTWIRNSILQTRVPISGMGRDDAGEIYVLTMTGSVLKITSGL